MFEEDVDPSELVRDARVKRVDRGRVLLCSQRARLWPGLTAMYPDYDVHRRRTERELPVIVLSPA